MTKPSSRGRIPLLLGGGLVGLFLLAMLFTPSRSIPAYAQGTCGATVTVVAGDTLTRIAARCGTTVQAILAANPGITNPNLIYVGQVVEIPGGQEATPTPTTASTTTPTPTPSGETTTYEVQAGDTLTRIAERFGTTVQAILAVNPQITNPNLIYVGQVIRVPSTGEVTPTPTPSGTPTPQRISFATGATEATVSGNLPANGEVTYVLRAEAGQLLEVNVTAPYAVHLTIVGANGVVIFDQPDETPFFRGTLPDTGDYQLILEADTQATSYSITVILPARISFATGTTSATVSGSLPANGVVDYILHAEAGQLLEVNVTAPQAVHLTIVGTDGVVVFDQPGDTPFFRGTLPDTEDYQLILEADAQATSYSMTVLIPERISFAPGTTSATEQAQLGAHQQHAYVLEAQAGQQMQVTVTASSGVVSLTIYGVDGTVLKNQMSEGTTFDGPLPITQDYIVAITAGSAAVSYTLVVEIT
jgi:LysM repeat protein